MTFIKFCAILFGGTYLYTNYHVYHEIRKNNDKNIIPSVLLTDYARQSGKKTYIEKYIFPPSRAKFVFSQDENSWSLKYSLDEKKSIIFENSGNE